MKLRVMHLPVLLLRSLTVCTACCRCSNVSFRADLQDKFVEFPQVASISSLTRVLRGAITAGLAELGVPSSIQRVWHCKFSLSVSIVFHMNALGVSVKHTIIFEAELLAIILAFVLWKNFVSKSPVVFFVDNNAARDVAISANGRSQLIACMVEQLLQVEEVSACYSWFARVPSPSNPADGPSRNDCEDLFRFGRLVSGSRRHSGHLHPKTR